jgi:hypothetical protein
MNAKQVVYDWTLGWQWLVSCAVGTAIFGMIAFLSMWAVAETVEATAGTAVGAAVGGGLFGGLFALGANLGPALLLHQRRLNGRGWLLSSVLAGILGLAPAFATAFSLFETMPNSAAVLFMGLSLGLPVSLAQWRGLRKQGVAAPGWVPIGTLAYLLALSAGIPLGGEGREWLSLGTVGLLLGAVTGLGMVWTLRRPATAAA